jgi:hypothetical protein
LFFHSKLLSFQGSGLKGGQHSNGFSEVAVILIFCIKIQQTVRFSNSEKQKVFHNILTD